MDTSTSATKNCSFLKSIEVSSYAPGYERTTVRRKTTIHTSFREHSYMTSDFFQAFLTYLPTLIRYFTTYAYVFSKIRWGLTYSRVPNTTVWNPYSFFGACPSYMALFGTTRLLNLKKSSFLHFYSELLAYWFFFAPLYK